MTRHQQQGKQWIVRLGLVLLMVLIMAGSLMIAGVVYPGNMLRVIVWLFIGWVVYFVTVILLALAFALNKKGKRRR